MATQTTTLFANQGSDVVFTVYVTEDDGTPKDLTNFIGRAKYARNPASVNKHDFEVTVRSPATDGIVDMILDGAYTASIKPGLYVFDMEILTNDSDSSPDRILEGVLELNPSVTQ